MDLLINWIFVSIGTILIFLGAILDLIAAILMIRFPNFYVRLHALTVGSIGGAFVPIIGAAFIAIGFESLGIYRWFMVGASIVVAIALWILGATGSHTLARAVHRSRTVEVYPKVADHLEEDEEKGVMK